MTEMRDHVVLRDHVVRRLPTDKDLLHRTPLVLTSRDRKILGAIGRNGYLTTELIELAFFPTVRSDGRATTAVYDRLRQLWLWGYVERVELPVSRVVGGRRPFLYALGAAGVRMVDAQARQSEAATRRRRLDRLSELFVEHNLTVSALWANLVALTRAAPLSFRRWDPEPDIRARRARVRDPATSRWLPFLPDALFQLDYRDGRIQCGIVEVDLGTHGLPAIHRKFRAFELYLAQGLFAKHWQQETFEVYVLTSSEKRLVHLWQIAREEVPTDRWNMYYFARTKILDPARFADADWLGLDNEPYSFLYDLGEGGGGA